VPPAADPPLLYSYPWAPTARPPAWRVTPCPLISRG
jgi:hypothetical protein